MKKIILVAVAICTLQMTAFSQKPWIGFQAGWDVSNMVAKGNAGKSASQSLVSPNTGILIDWALNKHISFQPGIGIIQKGGKWKSKDVFGAEELETVLTYLEIPANVIFYSKSAKQGFFAGAGFNLGYGLSGFRAIPDTSIYGSWDNLAESIHFGNGDDDDLKAFEIGTNLLLGYSFKRGMFFSFTGNFGLNNLSNKSGVQTRNNYFALKIGWLIRRA